MGHIFIDKHAHHYKQTVPLFVRVTDGALSGFIMRRVLSLLLRQIFDHPIFN